MIRQTDRMASISAPWPGEVGFPFFGIIIPHPPVAGVCWGDKFEEEGPGNGLPVGGGIPPFPDAVAVVKILSPESVIFPDPSALFTL